MQSNTSTVTIDTGEIGEQLVEEFFPKAERTDDWFDSKKDGTIREKTYEVKTFRLNNRDQGFWVESSQFTKLDNVDILYFVKIPESLSEGATIYECIDHKNPDVYENFKNLRSRCSRSISYYRLIGTDCAQSGYYQPFNHHQCRSRDCLSGCQ